MASIDIIFYVIIALILLFIGYIIGSIIQKIKNEVELNKKIPDIRKDAISKSRAVLSGQFSEQIAPYMPDFPYNPTEVRFIGKPIDFIVFKGMDEKNIGEVIFVEVKSGNAKLSNVEKSLKNAIENRNIKWEEYKVLNSKIN